MVRPRRTKSTDKHQSDAPAETGTGSIKPKVIVVAGDVCIDVMGFEHPPRQVDLDAPNWQLAGQTITQFRRGGAWLPAKMIRSMSAESDVRMQEIARKPWGEAGPVSDDDLPRLKPEDVVHSILEVGEFQQSTLKGSDKGAVVYRIVEFHGFAGPAGDNHPSLDVTIEKDTEYADVVVVDDAGNGFRNQEKSWPLAIRSSGRTPVVIHKLGRPLPLCGLGTAGKNSGNASRNELWDCIRDKHLERSIVIIDANDLRRTNIHISRRLSWERTARELIWELLGNPVLGELRDCHHLIVCFGNEGAMYYRSGIQGATKKWAVLPELTLLYDPRHAEDGFLEGYPGFMAGYRSAFAAALVATLIQNGGIDRVPEQASRNAIRPRANLDGKSATDHSSRHAELRTDMIAAIQAGLLAARNLHRCGLGTAGDAKSGPTRTVTMEIPTSKIILGSADQLPEIAHVEVPLSSSRDQKDPDHWCILTANDRRGSFLESLARDFVLRENVPQLAVVPRGMFGDLVTYDRTEIEGYRAIRNLIHEFLNQAAPKRPLSIAVFGPPGSGKSFGVEEVAKSVSGTSVKVQKLEFNVSQFRDPEELAAALQVVRDRVVSGEVPLVFFDEFDAQLGDQPYGWLRYFLAPMQDGKFLDRGTLHPIGRAIFVFAGGTRPSFQQFFPWGLGETATAGNLTPAATSGTHSSPATSAPASMDPQRQFCDAKGPDFVSRLRGYINVMGPNPRTPNDEAYVIRRALLLRSLLKRKASHLLDVRQEAQIDDGVLRAMLKVSRYYHGARSMEAVLDMSMLANQKRLVAASLPSQDQLELHVPAAEFCQLVHGDRPFGSVRETIARAIHARYRAKQNKPLDHVSMQPWRTLREDLRDSNLAQADDIPGKLQVAGLGYESVETPAFELARQNKEVFASALGGTGDGTKSSKHLEQLAEREHQRWVAEKLHAGWCWAEVRDDSKKRHPDLVPWSELSDETKEYDRDFIRAIPAILARAGYRLFPLPKR